MKKFIIFLFILFFSTALLSSNDFQTLLNKANNLYQQEKYLEALSCYLDIIDSGIKDSRVYYNIANTYFRLNKIGKAILFYERAKRISPRDPDVIYNLSFLKSIVKEQQEENPILLFFSKVYGIFSLNEISVIFSILYFSLIILVGINIILKSRKIKIINIGLISLVILIGIWLSSRAIKEKINKQAIVIKKQSPVYSGPGEDYTLGFSLPEGIKVDLIKKERDWWEIGYKEKGVRGWIRKENIEEI